MAPLDRVYLLEVVLSAAATSDDALLAAIQAAVDNVRDQRKARIRDEHGRVTATVDVLLIGLDLDLCELLSERRYSDAHMTDQVARYITDYERAASDPSLTRERTAEHVATITSMLQGQTWGAFIQGALPSSPRQKPRKRASQRTTAAKVKTDPWRVPDTDEPVAYTGGVSNAVGLIIERLLQVSPRRLRELRAAYRDGLVSVDEVRAAERDAYERVNPLHALRDLCVVYLATERGADSTGAFHGERSMSREGIIEALEIALRILREHAGD